MSVLEPLRILLVDDHVLFRSGVKAELSSYPHIKVVGEAADGSEALARARTCQPDVILMDISMPRGSGLEAVEKIKKEMPHVRVIMLTVHDDDEHLFEAIKRGADGYLLKDLEPKELLDMLDRVRHGEAAINGKLAVRILRELRLPDQPAAAVPAPPEALTSREIEVLERVVQGDTNAEIAERLVISENTVKMHLSNILDKLHLQNRIQAAVYAVREGIVPDP
jgi:two-component system nitrate/nitrite response regulator NarL